MNSTTASRSPAAQRSAARKRTRPAGRHGLATIALHWSSAAAVLLAVSAVLLREGVEEPALRATLMGLHRQAGLFVLLALLPRLVLRCTQGMADFSQGLPRWMRGLALAAHAGLYLCLLALPLLGYAAANAHGVSLQLFGLLPLPALVADDPDLADQLTDWHAGAAWALLALLVAHVGAALWHHRVRRDGVLAAMLPLLQRR